MKNTILFLLSVGLFAQDTEIQNYEVIKNVEDFEIRFYPPSMKAKVTSDRNFAKLFRYISGNNVNNEKIAMTAPVYMTSKNGKNTMEFVLPSIYSEKNAVKPIDKDIEVYLSKPGYYAAMRFGGYSNSEKVKKHHDLLMKKLLENNLKPYKEQPVSLSYNSPYKVFNRRNEVLIRLDFP